MGIKLGIIGCGAIGTSLYKFIVEQLLEFVDGVQVFDVDSNKTEKLAAKKDNVIIAKSIDDLIEKADIVIEAASPDVVPELLRKVVEKQKNLMVMSIGGLLNCSEWIDQARQKGLRILLPSGAIAGLDAVKSFGIAGIDSVTLTTRKGPKSLEGAPYLIENKIDVMNIAGETVIFDGNVLDAIKGFPKNVNVSALLSLAGIGPINTKVKIVTSPEYTSNIHEIQVIGKAGKVTICCENVPFPENPKTSYSAALAAMASLKQYFDTIRMGT